MMSHREMEKREEDKIRVWVEESVEFIEWVILPK